MLGDKPLPPDLHPGSASAAPALSPADAAAFRQRIYELAAPLYRDLPWRNTRDPYAILVSEVMLQQTQVSRVLAYWEVWMRDFPDPAALAAASLEDLLGHWQGLGYNRRALALQRAAQSVLQLHGGRIPQEEKELLALPGVGASTAAGIRAFAFGLPGIYLETNVRSVFLHEFFPQREGVPDRELLPLLEACCDPDDPRSWYYALMDYGAWLKRAFPNPSRRSKAHSRQSAFEGSHRQKRARALRLFMTAPQGLSSDEVQRALSDAELAQGRLALPLSAVEEILHELEAEGFIRSNESLWFLG